MANTTTKARSNAAPQTSHPTGRVRAIGLKMQRETHEVDEAVSTSYEEIDAYIERKMHRLNIPGASLAIVEGDRIAHLRGFGRARPGGEVPSARTPFFLGSTTKSITALAVMQLVEAGKVELEAPVQRYLPWFRVADPSISAQMTVRHLLNQTGGLSLLSGCIPLADLDQSPGAAERQARALSTLRVSRPVGSAFEYSNTNYNLLGLIIEAASGEPYEDYIKTHIFAPLEMRHSFTTRRDAVPDGLAVGHRYWFAHPIAAVVSPDQPVPRGSLASGQLISCAQDMAHYLTAHLNGGRYHDVQVLSPSGIAEMHRGVVDTRMMDFSTGQYAMGWYSEQWGPTRVLTHTGVVPDFFAFMALLPEQKKGVILLINADHFLMTVPLAEVGMGVTRLLDGRRPVRSKLSSVIPWALRGLLLIPALQILDVTATIRLLRRWHQGSNTGPQSSRKWGRCILLPLFPNLLVALLLVPMRRMGGFLRLFAPDASWIALASGSFAAIWAVLRTGLLLRALRRSDTAMALRSRGRRAATG